MRRIAALLAAFLAPTNAFYAALPSSHSAAARTAAAAATEEPAVDLMHSGLTDALASASFECGPLEVGPLFGALGRDEVFLTQFWKQRPFLCTTALPQLAGAFTMEDVQQEVEREFVEAGRGTFTSDSGWSMAAVSQPRGRSFEEAKLRFVDVEKAMKQRSGTVVVNSAGANMRALAGICLDSTDALSLPTALNLYLTAPGQETSAPPHTDKQDVFVLQTEGQKRWRVFAPPPPRNKPEADPLARGKGSDKLSLEELGPPLIDTVLRPGQVLYMPAGWPHTTDTVAIDQPTEEELRPSVHLTIGADSHVWGLDCACFYVLARRRSGLSDGLKEGASFVSAAAQLTKLEPALYWEMLEAFPVGFLDGGRMEGLRRWSEMRTAVAAAATERLQEKLRALEPAMAAAGLPNAEGALDAAVVRETAERLVDHHALVTGIMKSMYGDVFHALSEAPRDLSSLRSKPYFEKLEAAMVELDAWSKAGRAKQVAAATPAEAVAAPPKPKGMGVGMGAKGGRAKKKK